MNQEDRQGIMGTNPEEKIKQQDIQQTEIKGGVQKKVQKISPYPFSLSAQFRKLGLPQNKTQYCQHPYGCIESITVATIKTFLAGILIKNGINLVFGLRKIITDPKSFFKIVLNKDSLKFGCFLGTFVLVFRTAVCTLRRMCSAQRQKYIPLISGFLSGLISSVFLEKKSRQSYGLFLFARAIDITYNSLVKKGVIPEFKYFYVLMYSIMMAISGYAYGNEPGSLSPEMNKFYLTFSNQTLCDLQMRQIWIERQNNYLAAKGIAPQNPLDYLPKLKAYYDKMKL